MRPQYIFIQSLLILCFGLIIKTIQYNKAPERGFCIVQKQHGTGMPINQERIVACLPIKPRKKWFAFVYRKKIWQRTKRIVKNAQTGKKMIINGKQSVSLKKIVLNPA